MLDTIYIDGEKYRVFRIHGVDRYGYQQVDVGQEGAPAQGHNIPASWIADPCGAVFTNGHRYSTTPPVIEDHDDSLGGTMSCSTDTAATDD